MQALGVGERTPDRRGVPRCRRHHRQRPGRAGDGPGRRAASPGAFTSSWFATGNPVYLSQDRRTTFQMVYPAGEDGVDVVSGAKALQATAAQGLPDGTTVDVTGRLALTEATTDGAEPGAGVLVEAVVGGLGALVGPAVRVRHPAGCAHAAGRWRSPPSSTRSPWSGGVSYLTDVSAIVPFLIALIGLGLAIDYALVMLFRFRDELRDGNDVETAVVQTLTHAGRSVVVSGSTVAIGLLAMILLPLPLLRGHGGRRHAHPRRLGARRADAAPGAARRPRPTRQRGARHATTPARPRARRERRVGPLGPIRPAPAGRRRRCRHRRDRRAGRARHPANAHETPLARFPGGATAIAGRQGWPTPTSARA